MKKVLLIHGWNYRNYTGQTKEKDAWHNRLELVNNLEKKYEVFKLNLPGFCGQEEPNKVWNLDDYAEYIRDYLVQNNLNVDYILGYSFGAAVAIKYYLNYGSREKLILISPAIIRNNSKSKTFVKTPKIFDGIRRFLRDKYLIYIVKTPEVVYGTKFLRETYQNIVRIDLRDYVLNIKEDNLLIVYGDKDDMVNPVAVINYLSDGYKKRIKLIKNGDHNIGKTHYLEIIDFIEKNYK